MVLHHCCQAREEVAGPHWPLVDVVDLHGLDSQHHPVSVVLTVEPRQDAITTDAKQPGHHSELCRALSALLISAVLRVNQSMERSRI